MESHTELREMQLHEAIEQLTDENQSRILGVLEALFFAQHETEGETAVLEMEFGNNKT